MINSALTLAQANVDLECSLSVNAQIVTEDRASLGEKTIVGLCVLRETVQFCDPVGHRPELKISSALKQALKSSHASYKKWREREKEIRKKKEEEELRQKELSEKQEKERSRQLKKESLAKSED